MASSSSSPEQEFDVFVSFRGVNTRNNFTGNLIDALKEKGIDAFFDDNLRRGNDISVLFERIQQSKMSIVVFSEHYADSVWCLRELSKIIQRRRTCNHRVIPIFYKVKKSHVENQKGSFGAPFLNPEKSFKEDAHRVGEWKDALKEASNISGHVYDESPENKFVEKIVTEAQQMLDDLSPCVFKDSPGIERRSKELEELLMFNNDECVRTIGVLGMAGIGKTAVVESVYKHNCRKFDGYHFVEDVDEELERRHQLCDLQNKLLCKLLHRENVDVRANGRPYNFLRNKKLFIVLDNVTAQEQIDALIGQQKLYRKGSRIVLITRDKKLLQDNNADVTYVVPRLNDTEAMELFCLNAFSEKVCPMEEFKDLSKKIVDYSKGLPLALTSLGLSLCKKRELLYWEQRWKGLQKSGDMEIHRKLEKCYTKLNGEQKRIFLDVACFFRSEKEDFISSILTSNRVNAAEVIRELEDKCLVTISYNRLEMHDLVHTMGKCIGYAYMKRLAKRSRLCDHKDIRLVLEQNKGTDSVRGIFLNMSNVKRIELSPDAFVHTTGLEFLKLHNSHCSQWCDDGRTFESCKMLNYLPDNLVYLHWQGYPYDYLPSNFNPVELVDVNLRYSRIVKLWEDDKVPEKTEKLKWVDFSQSKRLLNISGLSEAKNLERLDLEGCMSLVDLGSSIEQMNKLIYLNLRDCTSLERLPEGINLKSLRTLILSGCSNLKEFHIISESIESLYLEGSAIEKVVERIEGLHKLCLLNLKNCGRLKSLPDDLYKLKALKELILSGCSALESLPPIREEMECLEILLMDGTSIKQTPERICLSNLKMFSFCRSSIEDPTGLVLPFSGSSRVLDLHLTNCNIIKIPDSFSSLHSLRRLCLSRNNIETLPQSIEKLYSLLLLDLKHCQKLHSLPVLPSNLQHLDAHGCVSLEKVAKQVVNPVTLPLVTARMHTTFIFTNCFKLKRIGQEAIVAQAQLKSQLLARTSLQLNNKGLFLDPLVAVCFPGSDIPSCFSHQKMESSIETDLLPHWCDNKFIGASLCVVVAFRDHEDPHANRFSVRCKCEFKNQSGQSIRFTFSLGGWNASCESSCHAPHKLDSDHVFISYNNFNMPLFEWSEESKNSCHSTSASLNFYLTDETERELECCKVTRCGMSLLYASDENDRGSQDIRVTDIDDQRTPSEAPMHIGRGSHSQVEERMNERINKISSQVFPPTKDFLTMSNSNSPAGSTETINLSDTPTLLNVNMCNVTKLDLTNFLMWSRQVKALLAGYGLFGYVDGSVMVPSPTVIVDNIVSPNSAYTIWTHQDNLIYSALLGAISMSIQPLLSTATTSAQIWETLSETYASSSPAHVTQLRFQLKQWKKNTKSIHEYIKGFTTRFDQLAVLEEPVGREEQIELILEGLTEDYNTVIDQIKGYDSTPTLSEILERLLNYELKLQASVVSSPSHPVSAHNTSFRSHNNTSSYQVNNCSGNQFQNRTWQRQQFQPRQGQPLPRGYQGRCQLCGIFGHSAQRCAQLQIYGPSYTPRQSSPQTQWQPRAHLATAPSYHANQWLLDSGATHHLTTDLHNLSLHQLYNGGEEMTITDGSGLQITHTGEGSQHGGPITPRRN